MLNSLSVWSDEPQMVAVEQEEYENKIFYEGEHIISVPLNSMDSDNYQVNYYDEYEPIGIVSSSCGQFSYSYGDGCILYINTEKVKCTKDSDIDSYTTFGIPEEDSKVLQK